MLIVLSPFNAFKVIIPKLSLLFYLFYPDKRKKKCFFIKIRDNFIKIQMKLLFTFYFITFFSQLHYLPAKWLRRATTWTSSTVEHQQRKIQFIHGSDICSGWRITANFIGSVPLFYRFYHRKYRCCRGHFRFDTPQRSAWSMIIALHFGTSPWRYATIPTLMWTRTTSTWSLAISFRIT